MSVKILVTGGAGFIGSNLCGALLKRGTEVVIVDNFNDYLYHVSVKRGNISSLYNSLRSLNLPESNLVVEEGDTRDCDFLKAVMDKHGIGLVAHLAALASVQPSIKDPLFYLDVNVKGALSTLEAAKNAGIKKFIYASSTAVYGNSTKQSLSETDNSDSPISPYASTKKTGELLCHSYHHLNKMDTVCLRFYTCYGPNQRPDMAIHKFTKAIFEGKEITLFGDGTTERDYTYVDDLVGGIINAIDWVENKSGIHEIFNLGESYTVSLIDMVKTLEKAIGKEAKIVRLPLQPGDIKRTCADITKAKKVLGYNPKVNFEEGIRRFIEWYKKNNKMQ